MRAAAASINLPLQLQIAQSRLQSGEVYALAADHFSEFQPLFQMFHNFFGFATVNASENAYKCKGAHVNHVSKRFNITAEEIAELTHILKYDIALYQSALHMHYNDNNDSKTQVSSH